MYVCIYLLFRITLQHIPLFLLWNPYFKTFAATLTFCWCYSLWLLLFSMAFLCCTLTGCCCNQLRFGRFFFLVTLEMTMMPMASLGFCCTTNVDIKYCPPQTNTHTERYTRSVSPFSDGGDG